MRIGILSDSHGRVDTTRKAIEALHQRGADLLLHLGDVGSEAVIDELAGHSARLVLGNCDLDIAGLTRYAEFLDIRVDHPMGVIEVDGRRIAFTHGHLPQLLERALADGAEYLLHGHTHERRDERIAGTRVINPGALFRAVRYTAAVLDPAADSLEFLEVAKFT